MSEKGEYYNPVTQIDEESLPTRHFTSKEEVVHALLVTLFRQGAVVWDIPPENKFINASVPHFVVQDKLQMRVRMGDIPLYFQGHFYFLKVLLFNRKRARTALGLRAGERELTHPQRETLNQGEGLLLLINEPVVELPGLQGEAYIQAYYDALDRGAVSYEVLLIDQQAFQHLKDLSLLPEGEHRFSFASISAHFPQKIRKFTYPEIIQGNLVSYLLHEPPFSPETPIQPIPPTPPLESPKLETIKKTRAAKPPKVKHPPEGGGIPAPEAKGEFQMHDALASVFRDAFGSKTQLRLWSAFLDGTEVSLAELAQRLQLHPKTVISNLQPLVAQGLVREQVPQYNVASDQKTYQLDFNAPKVRQLDAFLAELHSKLSQPHAAGEKPKTPDLSSVSSPQLPISQEAASPPSHISPDAVRHTLQLLYKLIKLDPQAVTYAVESILRQYPEAGPMPPFPPQGEAKPLVPRPETRPPPKPPARSEMPIHSLIQPDPNSILITTLGYHPEQITNALAAIGGKKILLLHDFSKGSKVKVEPLLQKIRHALDRSVQLHIEPIHALEIDTLRKRVSTWINENREAGKAIYLHLSGGSQRLTIAVLMAQYRDFDKVAGLLYSTQEIISPLLLPLFPWHSATIPPAELPLKGQLNLATVLEILNRTMPIPPPLDKPSDPQQKVLISTFGFQYDPLLRTIKELGASKVILIHTLNAKEFAHQMNRLTKGTPAIIENQPLLDQDIGQILTLLFGLIQREIQGGALVLLNLSGGVDKLTIAMILVSYLTSDKITSLTYSPQDGLPLPLPLFPWRLPTLGKNHK